MAHYVEHVAVVLVIAKRHHLIGRNTQGTTVIGKRGALARTETDKVRPFGSRRHHVNTVAKEALEILQGRRLIHLGHLEGNLNDVLVDVLGTADHRHIAVDLIAQMVDERIVAAYGVEVPLAGKGNVGMGVGDHGIRDIHRQVTLHRALDNGTPLAHHQGSVFAYIGELIGHRGKQVAQARILTAARRHKHDTATMQFIDEFKGLGTRLALPRMQQRAVQIACNQLDSLKTHMLPQSLLSTARRTLIGRPSKPALRIYALSRASFLRW